MLYNIFTTSIYRSKNYNLEYKNLILKILNENIANKLNQEVSNCGGFQTKSIQDLVFQEESINMLSYHFQNYLISQKCNIKKQIKIILLNSWINKNEKNNFNIPHNHPDSDFSAVYYVSAPSNSGKIKFFRNNILLEYNTKFSDFINSSDFHTEYEMEVTDNDIVIFPSYLLHSVLKNNSEHSRISVAYNIKFN